MNPDWLEILVCPVTRTPLRWERDRDELISEAAGLAYPIRSGTPILLVEAARRLPAGSDGETAEQ